MNITPTVPEIDVLELAKLLASDESFVLLDVREAMELDFAMIEDRRLKVVPMSRMAHLGAEAFTEELQEKDAKILVMCHHGIRSAQVAEWMLVHGWTNVFSVRGGIDAYAKQVDDSVGKY